MEFCAFYGTCTLSKSAAVRLLLWMLLLFSSGPDNDSHLMHTHWVRQMGYFVVVLKKQDAAQ